MLTVGNKYPKFSMQGCNEENDLIQADILLNDWTVMYFTQKTLHLSVQPKL